METRAIEEINKANRELLNAAKIGDVRRIGELLENGADVNTIDTSHYHFTPLHWAAGHAHTEAVKLLLSSGANPNARGTVHGYTALDIANTNPNAVDVKQALLAAMQDELIQPPAYKRFTL